MRRAQALGLAVAAAAALTLTGCEKPAPSVSVFSGTTSVHTEALCWAFDADVLAPGQCADDLVAGRDTTNVPTLAVTNGNTVGISVDQSVAEDGWTVGVVGGGTTELLTSTYYRFQFGAADTEPVLLQVRAGDTNRMRGLWIVKLQPEAA